MKGWQAFLRDSPERVVDVIDSGPFPLKQYGASKLTYADKRKGMMRFKGGDGRGGDLKMKSGMASVVYFDSDFCEGEFVPIDVPEAVLERHSDENIVEAFRKL